MLVVVQQEQQEQELLPCEVVVLQEYPVVVFLLPLLLPMVEQAMVLWLPSSRTKREREENKEQSS